jgi:hypothetical protein
MAGNVGYESTYQSVTGAGQKAYHSNETKKMESRL